MKIIVLGSLFLLASGAKLDNLSGAPQGEQFFQRTPNNNLIHVKYGNENRQDSFGHNQVSSLGARNQFSQNNRNQFSSQNQQQNRIQISARSQLSEERQQDNRFSTFQNQQSTRNLFPRFQQGQRVQFTVLNQRPDRNQFDSRDTFSFDQDQHNNRNQFSRQNQHNNRNQFFNQNQQNNNNQFSFQNQQINRNQFGFQIQHDDRNQFFTQNQQSNRNQFSTQNQQSNRNQFSTQNQQSNRNQFFSQNFPSTRTQFSSQTQHSNRNQFDNENRQFNREQFFNQGNQGLSQRFSFNENRYSNPNLVDIKQVNLHDSQFPRNQVQTQSNFNFHSNLNQNNNQFHQSSFNQGSRINQFNQNQGLNTFQHNQRNQNAFQNQQNQFDRINTNQQFSNTNEQNQQSLQFQRFQMKEIAGHIQSVEGDKILGVFQTFYVPQSANLFEGTTTSSFSCSTYGQGFYADQENNCQTFHVCTPVQTQESAATQYRFTFRCGEGEQFDQNTLTCSRSSNSCSSVSSLFNRSRQDSQRMFAGFPATTGSANTGVCYLANNQIITGVRK